MALVICGTSEREAPLTQQVVGTCLLTASKALRSKASARIGELERLLARPIASGSGRTSDAWVTVALEHDALATAFHLSDFTLPAEASPPSATPEPAIAALVTNPLEQTMLLHDMAQGLPGSGLSASEWNMIDAWRTTPIWTRFGVPASR